MWDGGDFLRKKSRTFFCQKSIARTRANTILRFVKTRLKRQTRVARKKKQQQKNIKVRKTSPTTHTTTRPIKIKRSVPKKDYVECKKLPNRKFLTRNGRCKADMYTRLLFSLDSRLSSRLSIIGPCHAKRVFGHMRTMKGRIRLRISAV